MKLYLADTITREGLNYNKELDCNNHLESFWVLRKKKTNNIDSWYCTGGKNENKQKRVTK